jgi:hypothetical protein
VTGQLPRREGLTATRFLSRLCKTPPGADDVQRSPLPPPVSILMQSAAVHHLLIGEHQYADHNPLSTPALESQPSLQSGGAVFALGDPNKLLRTAGRRPACRSDIRLWYERSRGQRVHCQRDFSLDYLYKLIDIRDAI